MPDPGKLPHLLKLLDDDSAVVRKAVQEELMAYGDTLDAALKALDEPPSDQQRRHIQELIAAYAKERLEEGWSAWFKLADDKQKLEAALTTLAQFQTGWTAHDKVKTLLDELAAEYRALHGESQPQKLAEFLFKEKKLKGAEDDYENPLNSNLIYVIEKKKGIPISLTCVYILVGARLGLDIGGCNYPGHFLARVEKDGHVFLVDCFNGGKFLPRQVFENSKIPVNVHAIIDQKISAEVIVIRILNNLIRAYQKAGQEENAGLMSEIRKAIKIDRDNSSETWE